MGDTKGRILLTALQLFSRDGYEAVSVRNIAEALDMTKGALYRHYKNKRDIFNSIIDRMIEIDAQRAKDYQMPVEQYDELPDSYGNASWKNIVQYTIEQLKFWTEDNFAVLFRRMLTLEQYRNAEMAELYSQCIVEGPVSYMEAMFRELMKKGILKAENPRQLAVEYYAPLFLLISMFDKTGENEGYAEILRNHTKQFIQIHGPESGGEK